MSDMPKALQDKRAKLFKHLSEDDADHAYRIFNACYREMKDDRNLLDQLMVDSMLAKDREDILVGALRYCARQSKNTTLRDEGHIARQALKQIGEVKDE